MLLGGSIIAVSAVFYLVIFLNPKAPTGETVIPVTSAPEESSQPNTSAPEENVQPVISSSDGDVLFKVETLTPMIKLVLKVIMIRC